MYQGKPAVCVIEFCDSLHWNCNEINDDFRLFDQNSHRGPERLV